MAVIPHKLSEVSHPRAEWQKKATKISGANIYGEEAAEIYNQTMIHWEWLPPETFPLSSMPSSSPATADRILEYITVVANALRDVATRTASQIPFLGRVCTLTLTIIPMVQVCNS
jgi:hypothetical protein